MGLGHSKSKRTTDMWDIQMADLSTDYNSSSSCSTYSYHSTINSSNDCMIANCPYPSYPDSFYCYLHCIAKDMVIKNQYMELQAIIIEEVLNEIKDMTVLEL